MGVGQFDAAADLWVPAPLLPTFHVRLIDGDVIRLSVAKGDADGKNVVAFVKPPKLRRRNKVQHLQ